MEGFMVRKPVIVDVVAPGSIGNREHFERAVAQLQADEFLVRVPNDLYGGTPIVSNTDERRWAHLKAALQSDSDIIWCVRGGYGSLRLLPQLAKIKKPNRRKLLVGYSDISSLHLFLNQKWKWPTLHGPLLDRIGKGVSSPEETASLFAVLKSQLTEVVFSGLQRVGAAQTKKGVKRGTMVGGNLMTLQSSLGTPWQLRGRKHIVFFEEIGERAYRIDRMLHHFAQAKAFDGVEAMVFGQIVGVDPDELALIHDTILPEFASRCRFPVFKGLPCGHGHPQMPLPLGTDATLKFDMSDAVLTIKTGVEMRGSRKK